MQKASFLAIVHKRGIWSQRSTECECGAAQQPACVPLPQGRVGTELGLKPGPMSGAKMLKAIIIKPETK